MTSNKVHEEIELKRVLAEGVEQELILTRTTDSDENEEFLIMRDGIEIGGVFYVYNDEKFSLFYDLTEADINTMSVFIFEEYIDSFRDLESSQVYYDFMSETIGIVARNKNILPEEIRYEIMLGFSDEICDVIEKGTLKVKCAVEVVECNKKV